MAWQFIIAGFSLGLVSSLHCVGMCGPLALALPVRHFIKTKRNFAIFLYQMGRVTTYSLLGLLFGIAGRGLYLAGFQQWFSVSIGILIFFLIIQYWLFRRRFEPTFMRKVYRGVQQVMLGFLNRKGTVSFLFFGMANGLLPCGMVYMALAAALVTTNVGHSVLFMAMFGVATIPAMMALTMLGRFVDVKIRNGFRKVVPFFMCLVAVILILRGLNLGIPFLSPALQSAAQPAINCH